MKTTHELAKELLALPDVPVLVEGWAQTDGMETRVVMTDYDQEGEYNPGSTAMLVQKER